MVPFDGKLIQILFSDRSKRDKDAVRDDYDSELIAAREERESRDARERRDARDRGREPARESRESRDNRDAKDSRDSRGDGRSSRESLERRDREREREKEREKERERERNDSYRKEDLAQDDRLYGRGHGRDDAGRSEGRVERADRNGRGRGRPTETADKGEACLMECFHGSLSRSERLPLSPLQAHSGTPAAPRWTAATTAGSRGVAPRGSEAWREGRTAAPPKEPQREFQTGTATRGRGGSSPETPPTTGGAGMGSGSAETTATEVRRRAVSMNLWCLKIQSNQLN